MILRCSNKSDAMTCVGNEVEFRGELGFRNARSRLRAQLGYLWHGRIKRQKSEQILWGKL